MICPYCTRDITRQVRAAAKAKARAYGAKGGAAGTGASKRRDVDYAALARLSAEARARKSLTPKPG